MTAQELLEALAGPLPALLQAEYDRRDLCVLSTRVAIEVGRYFGVEIEPVPCQVILFNRAYREHLDAGHEMDCARWYAENGAHAVGIGFSAETLPGRWNGHLVCAAGGMFADYSISQAERPLLGILTGDALIGPIFGGKVWNAVNDLGTEIEYRRIGDTSYRNGRDWGDAKRRTPLVGKLIREVKSARQALTTTSSQANLEEY